LGERSIGGVKWVGLRRGVWVGNAAAENRVVVVVKREGDLGVAITEERRRVWRGGEGWRRFHGELLWFRTSAAATGGADQHWPLL
jgi:hypothetical protein